MKLNAYTLMFVLLFAPYAVSEDDEDQVEDVPQVEEPQQEETLDLEQRTQAIDEKLLQIQRLNEMMILMQKNQQLEEQHQLSH